MFFWALCLASEGGAGERARAFGIIGTSTFGDADRCCAPATKAQKIRQLRMMHGLILLMIFS
jgi:hypothetical protein